MLGFIFYDYLSFSWSCGAYTISAHALLCKRNDNDVNYIPSNLYVGFQENMNIYFI